MRKSVEVIWKKAFSEEKRRCATRNIRLGTFVNLAQETADQSKCWLSAGTVPKKESFQAASEPGGVIAVAKG